MKLPLPSFHLIPSLLIRLIVLLVVFPKTKCAAKLPPNVSVPALCLEILSIVDTGNNNFNFRTNARCNYPPYGKDFEGGIPTGRFSNGKVPPDILPEELGIKEVLPAYLDPSLQPTELATAVNFASGAAGYDPLTPQLGSAIHLSGQLEMFKEYKWKLKELVGEDRLNFIVANSIYLLVLGSNDTASTYFEIYELGARRIGVFSAPPLGCIPFLRTVLGGVARNCVEKVNDAVQLFNRKLSKELDSLNKNLTDSRIVYVDADNPLLDMTLNYQKYGSKVGDRGCCGTSIVEVTYTCRWQPTCLDASDFAFWDSYHPTESAYKQLLIPLMQKYEKQFV